MKTEAIEQFSYQGVSGTVRDNKFKKIQKSGILLPAKCKKKSGGFSLPRSTGPAICGKPM